MKQCIFKGKSFVDKKGKSRKAYCRYYKMKCKGENDCKYFDDQMRIITRQVREEK